MGRKLSFTSITLGFTMQNVEYGIIMPSLWLYLQALGMHHEYFLGLVLGSFSLAQMISSPLFGFWTDRRPMKEVLIVSIVFGIFGNTLYGFAQHAWMVLIGRVLAGIGANIGVAANTYIVNTVEHDARSGLFARINAVSNIGLLAGPALNFLLLQVNFCTEPHHHGCVTPLRAPGFMMALFWAITGVFTFFAFTEPVRNVSSPDATEGSNLTRWQRYKALLTLPSLAVLCTMFIQLFNQTTLETLMTPVSNAFYGWRQLQNSLFYGALTVMFIALYVLISQMAKCMQDRMLILIGHLLIGAGEIALLVQFLVWGNGYVPSLEAFLVPIGTLCAGLPFFFTTVGSLFSKVVADPSIQGTGQGVLNAVGSAAAIAGPYWSGIALELGLSVTFGVLVGFWGLLSVLLAMAWRKLHVATPADEEQPAAKQPLKEPPKQPNTDKETDPLLSINR